MQMMVAKAYKERMWRWWPAATVLLIALMASPALAGEPPAQRSFPSPQQAVAALIKAVEQNNHAELQAILGPGSEELISSGDQVADQKGRARFLKAYREKNSLEEPKEGSALLLVGSREYPFPFPLVHQGKGWLFDSQAGGEEILNRRIGRNELHTMAVMQAYTDAQRAYAFLKRNSGGQEFARKFTSSEGKKDGLYWSTEEGEQESPFGPLIARASKEGYAPGPEGDGAEPFHGYYFQILTAQGEHASGGAFDYVVDGKMVLGFALLAYPSKYGASGIMTFMVNQEGVLYEKDLGEETPRAAAAITAFDPDETWQQVQEAAEEEEP
jgi:hypothetical protein